jgi:hypothetical protein
VQEAYDLGAAWYHDRLDPDWEPLAAAQAEDVFARVGLTGDFWKLT